MLEQISWRSSDIASVERLALSMRDGVTVPLRLRPLWKACGSLLNGDMAIAADAAQFQIDAAAFGASAGLGAAVTMMMRG
jgi:hypothetical protein